MHPQLDFSGWPCTFPTKQPIFLGNQPWSGMRSGPVCGQTPGVEPGGHGTASVENQPSFPRGKATDTATAGHHCERCRGTNAGGCGWVWGGDQARNWGRRQKGIKTSPGPRCAGESRSRGRGGGTRAGNVGGLHPGLGALGLAPSRAAQLSPGGCGCVCVSAFVALAGTDGSRVRDGDKAQGRRDTGEELFCLSLVNKWEGGMCRC